MTMNAIRGRAMLVHAGALGDFVLALRVVAALRAAGADGVTLLGRTAFVELGRTAGIDRCVDFETGGCHALYHPELRLPDETATRMAGHALIVNMAGGDEAFVARLGAETGGRVICVDPNPRAGSIEHVTEQWFLDLNGTGIEAEGIGPPRIEAPAAPSKTTQRTIIIHPGSGGRAKCWPIERFVELASRLSSGGCVVRFVIGPAELDRWSETEHARLSAAAPVLTRERLIDLAALLASADYFVGNDSGVTHLAAAVGTPVTAIFGHADPRVWRPLGDCVTVLGGDDWPGVREVEVGILRRLDVADGAV